MAWVKLDDRFDEHIKFINAGPLAGWLWVCALAWSNRNGTNGHLPMRKVPQLANFEGVGVYTSAYSGDDVDVRLLADTLVEVGLWEVAVDGYEIHDYADYQLTTGELEARRQAKAAAGSAGGRAAARARATASASAGGEAESKPGSLLPKSNLPSSNGSGNALPEGFWRMVAEEKLKLQRPGSVGNAEPWLASTEAKSAAEHEQRALRLRADFVVTDRQLAQHVAANTCPQHYERRKTGA